MADFHGPAAPGDLDQGGQRDRVRGVAAVEGQFPGARGAADQQPAVPRAGITDADPGPVVAAVTLGAFTSGQPLPGLPGQAGSELISADRMPGPGGHPVVTRHGQHIPEMAVFQPGAQRPVVPVGLIRGGPGKRDPGGDRPLDHPPGQLRLGREPHVSGDPGGLAAGRVTGPGPWQVQLAVDQRVPGRGRIAQVDRDLGVLDPPGRAGVLPLDAGRGGAFLQVTGIVDHQHRVGVAYLIGDVAAQVIADPVGVPPGPRQQVLHPVRRGVPGLLRDRPAVLARQLGQQAQHERPRPAPRLHPAET